MSAFESGASVDAFAVGATVTAAAARMVALRAEIFFTGCPFGKDRGAEDKAYIGCFNDYESPVTGEQVYGQRF